MIPVILIGLLFIGMMTLVFWSNWQKYTPTGFAFFCATLLICMPLGVFSGLHSTFPSSAPRKQVTGRLTWITKHGQGRSLYYTFGVLLNDGAELGFKEAAIVPRSSVGEMIAVTYLDEKSSNDDPRAITIRVLTGRRAGSESAVSADWLGPWLGVLFAILAGIVCLIFATRHTRKKSKSVESTSDELTNLGIVD